MKILEINIFGTMVGGTERYLMLHGKWFLKNHVELHHVYLEDVLSREAALIPDIPFTCLPHLSPHWNHQTQIQENEKAALAFDRLVRTIKPDLIHIHNIYWPNFILQHSHNIPIVRSVHDFRFLCLRLDRLLSNHQERCRSPLGIACILSGCVQKNIHEMARFLSLYEEKERYIQQKHFVVKSMFMKSLMVKNGFSPSQIQVIPIGIQIPNALKPIAKKNYMLFAGRLSHEKGIPTLLSAISQLPSSVVLKIAGTGPEGTNLKTMAHTLGIEDRVHFLGYVDPKQLALLYQEALASIVPSLWDEPFGLTGLESMSYKTPVIASRVGGISEWLRDGVTGYLVPPNQPTALSEKIIQFYQYKNLALEMGEAAQEDMQARFDLDMISQQLYHHLSAIAHSNTLK